MNKGAVQHLAGGNFAFPLDQETLMLRLKAARGDLKQVQVIYGSRFPEDGLDPSRAKEMDLIASDQEYDYFQTTIQLSDARFRYHFWLDDGKEQYWYNEEGFFLNRPRGFDSGFFSFPCINHNDIYRAPAWVRDAVFYQIFPERFYNGDQNNDPVTVQPWGGKPASDSFFGGDLAGIIAKLSYLKELGINALYLTPVFNSPSNHKYNIDDYYRIDPGFGDLETARELVNQAHRQGIRVVFDAVYNHSGFDFFAFRDLREKGPDSPYLDWFQIDSLPLRTNPPLNYRTFANHIVDMPKLNTSNPAVQQYLLDSARYWVEELDLDGWRLDVADEVDHQFWKKFRRELKAVKADLYLVGEIWHNANQWLQGDEFDGTMNYNLSRIIFDFFAKDRSGPGLFASRLTSNWMRYQNEVNYYLLNLLDSHDTARIANIFGGEREKMKLAILFQLTYPGVPMIYYGDEIGLTGGNDPDCRGCMVWEKDKQDQELFKYYQKLIKIRHELTPLRRGSFTTILADDLNNLYGFKMVEKDQVVVVIINNSPHHQQVNLPADRISFEQAELQDQLSGICYPLVNNTFTLDVLPFQGLILK
ncbi:MAG: glycoside hydrolase family 13 protein [Halanaerobiales bacterium]|nr:glycoside hydrolase family 13 protein [Halanaerobiales bacterium]